MSTDVNNANHDRPLKRKVATIPPVIKDAIEYSEQLPAYTTISDLVENDPEVKKFIDDMNNLDGKTILPEREKPNPLGPTPGIPQKLLKERNEYIVSLSLMGLSSGTILRSSNTQAKSRGW